jgi:predicted  nucleic acid-binding Zn-ribbon protein
MTGVAKKLIENLVMLQEIELESNSIQSQLSELPQKLAKIDEKLKTVREAIGEEENRLNELKKKYRSYESDAEMNLSRIKKSREKLNAAKTNKEYQSSLKEIEDLELINSKLEDDMLECLETMDKIEAEIDTKKKEYAQLTDRVNTEKDLLQQESEEAEKRLIRLNTDWSSLKEMIDPVLLEKYNTVKERVGSVAITPVKNAVCQGCNVNIPPQLYNELQRLESLMFCPHCQRIIYPLAS